MFGFTIEAPAFKLTLVLNTHQLRGPHFNGRFANTLKTQRQQAKTGGRKTGKELSKEIKSESFCFKVRMTQSYFVTSAVVTWQQTGKNFFRIGQIKIKSNLTLYLLTRVEDCHMLTI